MKKQYYNPLASNFSDNKDKNYTDENQYLIKNASLIN